MVQILEVRTHMKNRSHHFIAISKYMIIFSSAFSNSTTQHTIAHTHKHNFLFFTNYSLILVSIFVSSLQDNDPLFHLKESKCILEKTAVSENKFMIVRKAFNY